MMKGKRQMRNYVLGTLLLGASAVGQTNETKPLVTLTGTLQPKFSVEVSAKDIKSISDSMNQLTHLESIEVDVNDFMKPGDEVAIRNAASRISKIFISVAEKVADMRMITYQLSGLSTISDADSLPGLYRAFDTKFKSDYSSIISSLMDTDAELLVAMKRCVTATCVIGVGNAQKELFRFGAMLNQGFTVNEASKFNTSFQFSSSLISASLKSTFEQMFPPNKTGSDYELLIAAVLTPFVSAAKKATQIGENIANAVISPKATWLQLSAPKLKRTQRQSVLLYQPEINRELFVRINKTAYVESPKQNAEIEISLKHALVAQEVLDAYGGYQNMQRYLNAQPHQTANGFLGLSSSISNIIRKRSGEDFNNLDRYGQFKLQLNQNGSINLLVAGVDFEVGKEDWDDKETVFKSDLTHVRGAVFTLDNQNPSISTFNVRLVDAQIELPILKLFGKRFPDGLSVYGGGYVGYGRTNLKGNANDAFDLSKAPNLKVQGSRGPDETVRLQGLNASTWVGVQVSLSVSKSNAIIGRGQIESGAQGTRDVNGLEFNQDHLIISESDPADLSNPWTSEPRPSFPQRILFQNKTLIAEFRHQLKNKRMVTLFYEGSWRNASMHIENNLRREKGKDGYGNAVYESKPISGLNFSQVKFQQIGIRFSL